MMGNVGCLRKEAIQKFVLQGFLQQCASNISLQQVLDNCDLLLSDLLESGPAVEGNNYAQMEQEERARRATAGRSLPPSPEIAVILNAIARDSRTAQEVQSSTNQLLESAYSLCKVMDSYLNDDKDKDYRLAVPKHKLWLEQFKASIDATAKELSRLQQSGIFEDRGLQLEHLFADYDDDPESLVKLYNTVRRQSARLYGQLQYVCSDLKLAIIALQTLVSHASDVSTDIICYISQQSNGTATSCCSVEATNALHTISTHVGDCQTLCARSINHISQSLPKPIREERGTAKHKPQKKTFRQTFQKLRSRFSNGTTNKNNIVVREQDGEAPSANGLEFRSCPEDLSKLFVNSALVSIEGEEGCNDASSARCQPADTRTKINKYDLGSLKILDEQAYRVSAALLLDYYQMIQRDSHVNPSSVEATNQAEVMQNTVNCYRGLFVAMRILDRINKVRLTLGSLHTRHAPNEKSDAEKRQIIPIIVFQAKETIKNNAGALQRDIITLARLIGPSSNPELLTLSSAMAAVIGQGWTWIAGLNPSDNDEIAEQKLRLAIENNWRLLAADAVAVLAVKSPNQSSDNSDATALRCANKSRQTRMQAMARLMSEKGNLVVGIQNLILKALQVQHAMVKLVPQDKIEVSEAACTKREDRRILNDISILNRLKADLSLFGRTGNWGYSPKNISETMSNAFFSALAIFVAAVKLADCGNNMFPDMGNEALRSAESNEPCTANKIPYLEACTELGYALLGLKEAVLAGKANSDAPCLYTNFTLVITNIIKKLEDDLPHKSATEDQVDGPARHQAETLSPAAGNGSDVTEELDAESDTVSLASTMSFIYAPTAKGISVEEMQQKIYGSDEAGIQRDSSTINDHSDDAQQPHPMLASIVHGMHTLRPDSNQVRDDSRQPDELEGANQLSLDGNALQPSRHDCKPEEAPESAIEGKDHDHATVVAPSPCEVRQAPQIEVIGAAETHPPQSRTNNADNIAPKHQRVLAINLYSLTGGEQLGSSGGASNRVEFCASLLFLFTGYLCTHVVVRTICKRILGNSSTNSAGREGDVLISKKRHFMGFTLPLLLQSIITNAAVSVALFSILVGFSSLDPTLIAVIAVGIPALFLLSSALPTLVRYGESLSRGISIDELDRHEGRDNRLLHFHMCISNPLFACLTLLHLLLVAPIIMLARAISARANRGGKQAALESAQLVAVPEQDKMCIDIETAIPADVLKASQ